MSAASPDTLTNPEFGFLPSTAGVLTIGGTGVGFPEGDIVLTESHETAFLKPDNVLSKLDAVVISRGLTAALSVSENLLENFQYAWNTDAPTSDILTLDDDVGAPAALLVNTKAPTQGATGARIVSIPKALGVDGSSYNVAQAAHQTLGMNFEAIGDASANGLLATITDTYV